MTAPVDHDKLHQHQNIDIADHGHVLPWLTRPGSDRQVGRPRYTGRKDSPPDGAGMGRGESKGEGPKEAQGAKEVKGAKEAPVQEVGVLPGSSKNLSTWWIAFGALLLANFGTRLHRWVILTSPAWSSD